MTGFSCVSDRVTSVSLSSWNGRTVRAALSTACAVIAAHTRTRPAARCPSGPLTRWEPLRPSRRPPHSRCPSCRPLNPPQPTGRSRRSRTPSRSGRSPGACMRAAVSDQLNYHSAESIHPLINTLLHKINIPHILHSFPLAN